MDGLSPAISIEQRTTGSNPRSTVGTVTEIYDYLRLLFANIGEPHCPSCGREIASQSVDRMVESIFADPRGPRVNVLAPIVRGRKGEFKRELADIRARGFTRIRVDGEVRSTEDDIKLDRRRNHWLEVVVDRLIVRSGAERRLTESLELALRLASDVVVINTESGGDRLLSRRLACIHCDINVPEMTPRAFSFNSPHGACRECQGLGAVQDFDPERIVPDDGKSLAEGAIRPWARGDRTLVREALGRLSRHFDIDLEAAYRELPRRQRDLLMSGPPGSVRGPGKVRGSGAAFAKRDPFGKDFEGVLSNLRRRYESGTALQREELEPYRALRPCSACGGERLRPESRAVRVKGRTLADYVGVPITAALATFDELDLDEREAIVADRVLREIRDRLRFLCDVGVGYLSLARGASTLSGGEAQRIRLATQIGANLTGVLYVLDEPSIGLHQRDNRLLLTTLTRLRDLGNTVVVVEHDEETIRAADYVVDLGSGAGEHGGNVVFQGTPSELVGDGDASLTGMYLRGDRIIATPKVRRPHLHGQLTIRAASANNLKGIDVAFPLGRAHRGDRGERIGKVDAGERHPVPLPRPDPAQRHPRAGRPRGHRRHRARRQGDSDRPVGHRADAPLQSGDLYGDVHVRSRALLDAPGSPGPRLPARAVLLQRQGRPVRGLPGRRADCGRDALPARRLRHLRAVQGAALQSRDARDQVPRRVGRRDARF